MLRRALRATKRYFPAALSSLRKKDGLAKKKHISTSSPAAANRLTTAKLHSRMGARPQTPHLLTSSLSIPRLRSQLTASSSKQKKRNQKQQNTYYNLAGVIAGAGLIFWMIKDQIKFHFHKGEEGDVLTEDQLYHDDQDSQYIHVRDLTPAGNGSGISGHNVPTKVFLAASNKAFENFENYYYHKECSEIRREYVLHSFGQLIIGADTHPDTRLCYAPNSDHTSAHYSLLTESIGRNQNLELHAKQMKKNPIHLQLIDNLGVAVAFSNLVGSHDNYFKNIVVVYKGNKLDSYAIDFEVTSDMFMRTFNPNPAEATKTAYHALKTGIILEYESVPANSLDYFHKANQGTSGAETLTDRGDGLRLYGQEFRDMCQESIERDFASGKILALYINAANITDEQIVALVEPIKPFSTENEIKFLEEELKTIRHKAQQCLDTYGYQDAYRKDEQPIPMVPISSFNSTEIDCTGTALPKP